MTSIWKIAFLLAFCISTLCCNEHKKNEYDFIVYHLEPTQQVKLYWKNSKAELYGNLGKLKNELDSLHNPLLFAMNAGMYKTDRSPQGLFIQNDSIINAKDILSGNGNFYLKPNGIFFITDDGQSRICRSEELTNYKNIRYATQSGPMLIINDQIHPSFKQNSQSLYIRNGVGITANGEVLFVMSKKEINFYAFANYFKQLGCKNALYLDGYVSRTYAPSEHWVQTDGDLGVIIGVTKK